MIRVCDQNSLWRAAPSAKVEHKMQDKIRDEVTGATTIVHSVPDNGFTPHTHDEGAEILVLKGDAPEDDQSLTACHGLRLPHGTITDRTTGAAGARIKAKTGHLQKMVNV